jgi:hypothetical protein
MRSRADSARGTPGGQPLLVLVVLGEPGGVDTGDPDAATPHLDDLGETTDRGRDPVVGTIRGTFLPKRPETGGEDLALGLTDLVGIEELGPGDDRLTLIEGVVLSTVQVMVTRDDQDPAVPAGAAEGLFEG